MNTFLRRFHDIDRYSLSLAGGKGANLGELSRLGGVNVPDGFCVTTRAFERVVAANATVQALIGQLAVTDQVPAVSRELRRIIEELPIPPDMAAEVAALLDEHAAYAVRSSATAEDLPTASFAGQQDTYLNITGTKAVLAHIGKCWASLFTERAVMYRSQQGFDHRKVQLAVVVQEMVFPEAAGILFTADPLSGHRKICSIDAGFGLGEALVAGMVNADNYKVRDGAIIARQVPVKKLAIYASPEGGTVTRAIDAAGQVLTDVQALQLAQLGRHIEAHFGRPQDIEWCLAKGIFYIVQSRPVTTLYPIPQVNDGAAHVYLSVGHQQMMTDALKPLAVSVRQLTGMRPFYEAGGRLFVDVAQQLANPASRAMLLRMTEQFDPLTGDALQTILNRGDLITPLPEGTPGAPPLPAAGAFDNDPAIVNTLVNEAQTSIAALQRDIQAHSGPALFDFIREDMQELKRLLSDPRSSTVFMTAMNAATWINEHMLEWLGEQNAADVLTQSAPGNVTSEMGLALLDVADVIRPYPAVVAALHTLTDLSLLDNLDGGAASRQAIEQYLHQYGMRCAGEIDITRPRWREKPAILMPLLLTHIKSFAPGESRRRFEQGLAEAREKEASLLAKLRQLPDGEQKAIDTKAKIELVRHFIGYREYPKYAMICRYFIYRLALLKEARSLLQAGVIAEEEDIYYFTFEELREVVRTQQADRELVAGRKTQFHLHEKLHTPRVLTSDGEVLNGTYKRGAIPAGAIAGLPVSAGVVEGRARVIRQLEDADMGENDILVTAFTDPSWTPLFVAIKGLVTEVGGVMTHGSVIAREYGLPAVVGVDNATRLIKDGQMIRVHGTEGYIEFI